LESQTCLPTASLTANGSDRRVLVRIPALDGIRGTAICLVLLWHGFFTALTNLPNHSHVARLVALGRFTWSGVDLFFVLSGFLIGGILLDTAGAEHYFAPFYIRRVHRILPLYVVVMILAFSAREYSGVRYRCTAMAPRRMANNALLFMAGNSSIHNFSIPAIHRLSKTK
jgi:peptidoglycan/LPS O-acetylase OafA/YrhL